MKITKKTRKQSKSTGRFFVRRDPEPRDQRIYDWATGGPRIVRRHPFFGRHDGFSHAIRNDNTPPPTPSWRTVNSNSLRACVYGGAKRLFRNVSGQTGSNTRGAAEYMAYVDKAESVLKFEKALSLIIIMARPRIERRSRTGSRRWFVT